MKTSESILKILPALFKVKQNLKSVTKSADNPYFKSKYVDLNALLDEVEPLLSENGIILLQPVNGNTVETVLLHTSGEYIASSMDMVLSKQDMQAAGSAVSYARRYTLQSLLSMKALDDDAEQSVGRGNKAETSSSFSKAPAKEEKKDSKPPVKKSSFGPKVQSSDKKETKEETKPSAVGSWS